MMKICKHRSKIWDNLWCNRACSYCTANEHELCKHKEFETVNKTNADRIRSMSDEELAEWITNGISSDSCDYCNYNNGYCDGSPCRRKSNADIIVEWLQQPAEECK